MPTNSLATLPRVHGFALGSLRLGAVASPLTLVLVGLPAHAESPAEDDEVAAEVASDDDDDDDDDDDVDGAEDTRLRLNVESELLGGSYFRSDDDGLDDSVSFGFGLARPALLDGGNGVFLRPLFSVGLGYVFADERAIIGTKFALTVDGYDLADGDRLVAVGGRLIPYFQWMFRPQRAVRPYVEVRAGFGGSSSTARDRDGVMGRVTNSFIYPQVGAGAGLHMFPRDWFSVDLGLNVDYAAPFGRTRQSEGPDTDWNKLGDVVNYGLMLGVSTWF